MSTLVDVAPPGPGWSRATAADLSRVLVGSVAIPVTVSGVPVAYVEDADGARALAVSGWTGTAPTSGEVALCRTAQSWMASAEDIYGLVSGTGDIVDACASVPASSTSSVLPLGAECAPAASREVSTCARVDADRNPSGDLVLTTTVSLQADRTRAPSWQPAVGSSH